MTDIPNPVQHVPTPGAHKLGNMPRWVPVAAGGAGIGLFMLLRHQSSAAAATADTSAAAGGAAGYDANGNPVDANGNPVNPGGDPGAYPDPSYQGMSQGTPVDYSGSVFQPQQGFSGGGGTTVLPIVSLPPGGASTGGGMPLSQPGAHAPPKLTSIVGFQRMLNSIRNPHNEKALRITGRMDADTMARLRQFDATHHIGHAHGYQVGPNVRRALGRDPAGPVWHAGAR